MSKDELVKFLLKYDEYIRVADPITDGIQFIKSRSKGGQIQSRRYVEWEK